MLTDSFLEQKTWIIHSKETVFINVLAIDLRPNELKITIEATKQRNGQLIITLKCLIGKSSQSYRLFKKYSCDLLISFIYVLHNLNKNSQKAKKKNQSQTR